MALEGMLGVREGQEEGLETEILFACLASKSWYENFCCAFA